MVSLQLGFASYFSPFFFSFFPINFHLALSIFGMMGNDKQDINVLNLFAKLLQIFLKLHYLPIFFR